MLAQRLVRKLCPVCKKADARGRFHPVGCAACLNSGYKGRTGVYELVVLDETLRRMIHDGASEAQMDAHARTRTPSIAADGWAKCVAGITSVDEVLRVTREE